MEKSNGNTRNKHGNKMNIFDRLVGRLNTTKERISKLKNRIIEIS